MAHFLSLSAWSLEREDTKFGPSSRWSNRDMDPVPEESRTWSTLDYIAYWLSDAANAATWQMASFMLAVGLLWRQALPAIAVGNVIIAVCPFLVQLPQGSNKQIGGYGIDWNHWCTTTHCLPCHNPLFVWILVELLWRCQSSYYRNVLVRSAGESYVPNQYFSQIGSSHSQAQNVSIRCSKRYGHL